jgi:hypothetical protein
MMFLSHSKVKGFAKVNTENDQENRKHDENQWKLNAKAGNGDLLLGIEPPRV